MNPPNALCVGENLGFYEIQAPLGAGGVGEVYRATDTQLKRDVVLKVLPAAFSSEVGLGHTEARKA